MREFITLVANLNKFEQGIQKSANTSPESQAKIASRISPQRLRTPDAWWGWKARLATYSKKQQGAKPLLHVDNNVKDTNYFSTKTRKR